MITFLIPFLILLIDFTVIFYSNNELTTIGRINERTFGNDYRSNFILNPILSTVVAVQVSSLKNIKTSTTTMNYDFSIFVLIIIKYF